MTPRLRLTLLVVAALGIAGVAVFDSGAQATADHAPRPTAQQTRRPLAAQDLPARPTTADTPARAPVPVEVDLFAAKSWYVAPPPPPQPKPAAPPFPYAITGSAVGLGGGSDVTLFLTLGERNFVVRKGDIVGGNYRLDDVSGEQAEFTYLPLDERQHLQIGKIN